MEHYVSTKPYYILTDVPTPLGFIYNENEIGREIMATMDYGFEQFDTEEELAHRVDELVGIPGWYWMPEHRLD